MNVPIIMLYVFSVLLVPQSRVKEADSTELRVSLMRVLNDLGVANPENIADYVHLLPRNTFSSTIDRGGETEITVHTANGHSHTIDNVRLTQSNDAIAFQADVDGWNVEGSLSSYDRNQVKLQYQFQVPLDVFSSPPVTMIIKLGPTHNWLPTPIRASENRAGDIGPSEVGIQGVYATECKCIGKGSGDGACVARDCDDGNSCGDAKECLDTEVGGSTDFLSAAVFPCLLFSFSIMMLDRKRCPS